VAEYAFDVWNPELPKSDFWVRLTVEDQLLDAEFHSVLYGTGDGMLRIHGDHPDTQYLQRRAWVQVVRTDTIPERYLGGFFLEQGDFRAVSRKEAVGRVLTFTGRGGLSILERYVLGHSIYAPGQTHRGSVDIPGKWHWSGEPYGAMLTRVIEEGKHHPHAPYTPIAYGFTRVRDTDNLVWDELADYETPIGTDGLKLYADFMRLGLVAQMSADLLLITSRSVEDFGTDRSSASFAAGKVRFQAGANIANELPKRIAATREKTFVLIEDRIGDYQTIDEDIDGNPLTGVEAGKFLKSTTTADDAAIEKMGKLHLTSLQKQADQCQVQHVIGPGGASGADGYDPGPAGDYDVGDLVTVHTGTAEHDYNEQTIEVAGYRIFLEEGNWMAEAELGAQYMEPSVEAAGEKFSSVIRDGTPIRLCQPRQDTPGSPPSVEDHGFYVGDSTNPIPITVDSANGALYIGIISSPAPTLSWRPAYVNAGTPGASSGAFTLIEDGTAGAHTLRVYRMLNPALSTVGTSAILIDPGSSVRFLAAAAFVADVNQTTPETAFENNNLGSSTSSVTATATSSDVIIDFAGWAFTDATVTDPINTGSNTTILADSIDRSPGFTDQVLGAAFGNDATPTWDFTNSHSWRAIAVVVHGSDPGSSVVGDGREELVGTSTAVKRCDDTEHWHEVGSGAPTVTNDEDEGFRVGTLWVNDDGDAWLCTDITAGAAVWVQLVGTGGGGGGTPAFHGAKAYSTGTQNISSGGAGTAVAVTLGSEEFDTDAYHSTSSNTSRMTIPSGLAGKYLVQGMAFFQANSAGIRYGFIMKNRGVAGAAELRGSATRTLAPGNTGGISVQPQVIVDLAVGDFVEMMVEQNSGSTLTVGHATILPIQSMLEITLLGT
jgi:hypothetical protein